MYRGLLMSVVLVWIGVSGALSTRLTAAVLKDTIESFAEETLGVTAFQDYLSESVTFITRELNGADVLEKVADKMTQKYQRLVDLVQQTLVEEMIASYANSQAENPYKNCCDEDVIYPDFDKRLGLNVDYEQICVVGTALRQNPSEFIPSTIVPVWKRIYEEERSQGVQWIYYGSEEGVMYNYPAVEQCNPNYDPRYRPFYIETVTPIPKDIVIVIDKSGSMGDTHNGRKLMTIAIDAATTVIDTLNINDRVGLVTFSDEAEAPSGSSWPSSCYKTQLARATPENKDNLKQYVSFISNGGETYYRHALRTAFQLFKNAEPVEDDIRERRRVMLFLTDGKPSDSDSPSNSSEPGSQYPFGGYIYQDIREMNAELNNSVVILTYGLGNSIDLDFETILENIAKQVLHDPEAGEVTVGQFVKVENPDDLRSAMASYYNSHSVTINQGPHVHFTVPYQDAFGSGMIASICSSVFANVALKGVVCIDIAMEELLSELKYGTYGQLSYPFMVDIYSRVFYHPYTRIQTDITDHPKFTFLRTVEKGIDVDRMIESIINEGSGNLTKHSKKITSRGDAYLDGVDRIEEQTRYFWRKIDKTKYVIGVALLTKDKEVTVQLAADPPESFFYHKLSSRPRSENLDFCSHFNRLALKDEMAVQFSLRAFERSYEQLFNEEDVNTVSDYTDYFTLPEARNPGFKEQIKEFVYATSQLRDIFLARSEAWSPIPIWRFFATENGIFRVFPACELPKRYDATQRLWYIHAKHNERYLTLTRPYMGVNVDRPITTLAKVIRTKAPASIVLGVLGMDLYPSHLYHMLADSIPACLNNTCFIVDENGFIITHKDWTAPQFASVNVINVHISKMEPYVTRNLVQPQTGQYQYSMKYETCININDIRNQFTWRINGERSLYTADFEIHEIYDTNTFLVIKMTNNPTESCFSCSSQTYRSCLYTPTPEDCFCPCYEPESDRYEYCEDVFELSSDDFPICLPPLATVHDSRSSPDASLDTCYSFSCGSELDKSECASSLVCAWCVPRDAPSDVCDRSRVPSCITREQCASDQSEYNETLCTATTTITASSTSSRTKSTTSVSTTSTHLIREKTEKESDESDDGMPGWVWAVIALVILLILSVCVFGIIIIRYFVNMRKHDGVRSDQDNYDQLPAQRSSVVQPIQSIQHSLKPAKSDPINPCTLHAGLGYITPTTPDSGKASSEGTTEAAPRPQCLAAELPMELNVIQQPPFVHHHHHHHQQQLQDMNKTREYLTEHDV